MANYAVGDIQGCYKEFEKGLKKIKFNQKKDYLWLTGDLINRGPDSLKTLEKIYELRSRVHIVLGNHDLHFLAEAGLAAAAPLLDFAALAFAFDASPLVFDGLLLGFDAPPAFDALASAFDALGAAFDGLATPFAFLKMTSIVLLSIPVSNLSKLYMYFIYLSFSIS